MRGVLVLVLAAVFAALGAVFFLIGGWVAAVAAPAATLFAFSPVLGPALKR